MATPPIPVADRRRPSIQVPGTSPRAIPSVSPRAMPVPIPSPRAVPLPVPQRHGSISVHNGSFQAGSFGGGSGGFGGGSFHGSMHGSFHGAGHGSYRSSIGSATDLAAMGSPGGLPAARRSHRASHSGGSAGSFGGSVGAGPGSFGGSLSSSFVLDPAATDDADAWLDTQVGDVAEPASPSRVVPGNVGLEEATEILIKGDAQCLIVQTGDEYDLFDFADLNTVLLLVLSAATNEPLEALEALDERAREVVSSLKRGRRVGVRSVCDISGKNPCNSFPASTTLRRLLPLFAGGVHRVVLRTTPPRVLEASALLAHLTRLPPPLFRASLADIDLPLHRFVSLPLNASVMDAMQVMSLNGLSALGVVTGDAEREGEQSSLVGVITVTNCSKVVVPSEGKQALGMGLGEMCKAVMAAQHGGRERGEERVPVHTITPGTTLLHAANLLLATSSSRIFMRTPPASSPPLSPATSFDRLPPPTGLSFAGLPVPPSTQLSAQYVISILDILACLARAYASQLGTPELAAGSAVAIDEWDMMADNMSKRRRRASSSAAFSGFQTWRWAGDPTPF